VLNMLLLNTVLRLRWLLYIPTPNSNTVLLTVALKSDNASDIEFDFESEVVIELKLEAI